MHEPFYFIKYSKNRNQVEISKIKELCHSQSIYYYDYVKRFSEHNGKTIEKVRSITFQEGSFPMLFEIKLDKVIYDFEKTCKELENKATCMMYHEHKGKIKIKKNNN